MRLFGTRIGPLRAVALVFCAAAAVAGLAVMSADREEDPFGPDDSLLPSFSAGYQCSDARDQLNADALDYRIRYDGERWVADVRVSLVTGDLRSECLVRLGVPPGSTDTRPGGGRSPRVVSLERDGSTASGIATVTVEPGSRGEHALSVALPRDSEIFHALGLGRYLFRFSFFAPGEGASFKAGAVEVALPDGHSFVEAVPAAGSRPTGVRSRAWTLKADRNLEVVVTFEEDTVRTAADLAPEGVLVALAAIVALGVAPARRERRAEPRREEEPAPEPLTEPAPPRTPAPEEAPTGPPPPPPPPPTRPPAAPLRRPPPPPRERPPIEKAGRAGLLLVAAAFLVRLIRSRRARRR